MSSKQTVTMPNGSEYVRDEGGRIEAELRVSHAVLAQGVEARNDELSDILTGTDLLLDVGYEVVATEGQMVRVVVSGDPTMVLESMGHAPNP